MSDPYQLGSDLEWTKHANDELQREVKKKNRQLARLRLLCFLLLLASGWVIYRYSQVQPVEQLWDFRSVPWPVFPTGGTNR